MKIEYRVRPVTRYIVTRYESGHVVEDENGNEKTLGSSQTRGEYDNPDIAYEVAHALCKAERETAQEPLGSLNFIFPQHPSRAE